MKKIILAVAVAAVAIMAVASSASAGVERYQAQVATGLTVTGTYQGTEYVHTYTLNSKADGSFTGTGGMPSLGLQETISGTLDGGNIVIDATYKTYNTPFNWHYDGPLTGGGTYTDPLGQDVKVTAAVTTTTTTFRNHGDYVSFMGGADAAHSSIGMPVH